MVVGDDDFRREMESHKESIHLAVVGEGRYVASPYDCFRMPWWWMMKIDEVLRLELSKSVGGNQT